MTMKLLIDGRLVDGDEVLDVAHRRGGQCLPGMCTLVAQGWIAARLDP